MSYAPDLWWCPITFLAAYPMNSKKQMAATMQDFIRMYGAPIQLLTGYAKAKISHIVQDTHRLHAIKVASLNLVINSKNPLDVVSRM